MALLNSRLAQWRFRLTSTNNNVGTNELEALPFPDLLAGDRKVAKAWISTMESVGKALNQAYEALSKAILDKDRDYLERRVREAEGRLNAAVYEGFDLTPEEIAVVEGEWYGNAAPATMDLGQAVRQSQRGRRRRPALLSE
jgi:hypothetical protein